MIVICSRGQRELSLCEIVTTAERKIAFRDELRKQISRGLKAIRNDNSKIRTAEQRRQDEP